MKLKNVAVSDLRRELARRESGAAKLQATRAAISKQLAALEAELADLGMDAAPARRGRKPGRPKSSANKPGKVGRPKGKRAKNAMSLVDAILKGVPIGKTVSPAEAAVAAKRVGYKSSSANFGMIVANALGKDARFKKLGRGQYQVGGGKATAPKGKKPGKAKRKSAKRATKGKGTAKAAATTALAEVVAR